MSIVVGKDEQREEHVLLRVKDESLAKQLRQLLAGTEAKAKSLAIDLQFTDDRRGVLKVGDAEYPVLAQQLPTVVESYKTYDEINLVKATDVGQVLLVHPPGTELPADADDEAADGVTPPMQSTRTTQFRPQITAPPHRVTEVEKDIYAILNGKAPRGVEYIDVEEEYVVGPDGRGSWRPVKRDPNAPPPTAPKTQAKSRGKASKAAAEDDDEAEALEELLEDMQE